MIEKVAVGTDGSETAQKAVDFAFDVAEKFGAQVVICSAGGHPVVHQPHPGGGRDPRQGRRDG
jgi:nucleotide-binding universal stress UspA family protein